MGRRADPVASARGAEAAVRSTADVQLAEVAEGAYTAVIQPRPRRGVSSYPPPTTYAGVVTTTALAPDVAIAVQLVERIRIEEWPWRSAGFTHPLPYLRFSDSDFFEALQAWLASRAGDRPSFVQASVANLRRVLDDIMFVIDYDMIPGGEVLWVRKWYHGGHGGDSSPREVEFFQSHTLLIQNLGAELTRAINLVVVRARQADSRVLQTSGLALVDTGSDHAPMHPAEYTAEEQELPQPYPGLRGFPQVIMSRDIGALGQVHEGRPRTPADIEHWIDELINRTGGRPSGPPPPEIPPRALPRPESEETGGPDAEDRKRGSVLSHPLLLTAYAVLVVVSVIGGATAKPWLIGLSIGAVIAAVLTYRQLSRPSPPLWALLLVLVAGVVGAIAAEKISEEEPSDYPSAARPGTTPSSTLPPPGQPTGQLARGDLLFASVDGRRVADPISTPINRSFYLSFHVDNLGPDALRDVRVRVSLPTTAERAISVRGKAVSSNSNPEAAEDTVGVRFGGHRAGCLAFLPRSTVLRDSHGGTLARLPDGVTRTGIRLGRIDVSADAGRYVVFRVTSRSAEVGSDCR